MLSAADVRDRRVDGCVIDQRRRGTDEDRGTRMPTTARLPEALDGALLVRIAASDADWVQSLPPVPPGWGLTVSLAGPARDREAEALTARGYRLVGELPDRGAPRTADVLVPEGLRERERPWWWSFLLLAERVFDPRMGPVLALLGPVLQRHMDALTPRD